MGARFYELQFEIENQCLLDCIHCSSLATRKTGSRHYSDEDLIRFLSVFSENIHIYLTGGEPLLYDNLLSLCAAIIHCRPSAKIGLYTTGNCAGFQPISVKQAIKMKSTGIVDCYFSIYHHKPHIHDKWTKCFGSLERSIHSASNISAVGIIPKAHVVISKDNYLNLDEIIAFCETSGFKEIRFLKLSKSGSAVTNWHEIGLSDIQQDAIIQRLVENRKSYATRLTFSGYPNIHPCRSFENSIGCQAGTNLLYIDAYGDVYPCACTKRAPDSYKICNIKELERVQAFLTLQSSRTHNSHCINEVPANKENRYSLV